MKNNNDIGHAFRQQLDQLDKIPGAQVWQGIEAELDKKRKRRFLIFWLRFAGLFVGIAALLLAIATGGDKHSTTRTEPGSAVDGSPSTSNDKTNGRRDNDRSNQALPIEIGREIKKSGDAHHGHSNISGSVVDASENTGHQNGHHNPGKKAKKNRKINAKILMKNRRVHTQRIFENQRVRNAVISDKISSDKPTSFSADKTTTQPVTATLSATDSTAVTVNDSLPKKAQAKKQRKNQPKDSTAAANVTEEKYRTFAIFLYAAPTYYTHLSKKSSLDHRLDKNPGSGELEFNYGGYLCFDYNELWSFRVGFAMTKLRYTTENIDMTDAGFSQDFKDIDYRQGASNLTLAGQNPNAQFMKLEQRFTYFEIPLELKYALVNSRFMIEGIGGFSSFLLKDNSVVAFPDSGSSSELGSAKNTFGAHFTANLGIGFGYRFGENFRVNAEPAIRYHIKQNAISQNAINVLLQAGIQYNFNSTKKTTDKKIKK